MYGWPLRIKELEESKADKIESEPPKGPSEPYDERMKKDRSSYNAEWGNFALIFVLNFQKIKSISL